MLRKFKKFETRHLVSYKADSYSTVVGSQAGGAKRESPLHGGEIALGAMCVGLKVFGRGLV